MAVQEATVLLLEEDSATRDLYRRELGRRYRVLCAETAEQALTLLRDDEVRAVVLEPAWAEQGGWQLMEEIARLPEARQVPVVIVTYLEARRQGLSLGAAAYIIKPVLPAVLLTTLEQVLGQSWSHRQ
jgi:DNA-binding response OmpR family regulator